MRRSGWLLLIGTFLVTFEMTARVEDWVRFGTPIMSPVVSWMDLMISDRHGIHGRPNARFQKWMMNGLGMRGPQASIGKPRGTIRIIAAGASETFGLHESPGREFPRQLEDTLNAWLASGHCRENAPRRFEVLNAALPGISLPRLEQSLRQRITELNADVVVVYPTPTRYLNDDVATLELPSRLSATRALRPRAVDRMRSQVKEILPRPAQAWLQTWLRRRELAALLRGKPPDWRFTVVPNDRLAGYDGDLRRFIAAMRSSQAILILATHANSFVRAGQNDPAWLAETEVFYPRAQAPLVAEFDSIARQLTLRAAVDSSVLVIDLAHELGRERPTAVFSDFLHFTDFGAARVASSLRPAVVAAMQRRGSCRDA